MSSRNATLPGSAPLAREYPRGSGEMARLIRAFDWSATPLGPIERWPGTLRTIVQIMLAQRFPLLLWWGPEYVQIYNDAYSPIPGAKHPRCLGQPASECWTEIWNVIQPLIDTPFQGGPATWMEDLELEVNRRGFLEETHFTVAYSPVPDPGTQGGIGGVLATVHEITDEVIGKRRLALLHEIGSRLLSETKEAATAEESCALAAEMLAGHARAVPFALFYLLDEDRKEARLAGAAGATVGGDIDPVTIDMEEQIRARERGLAPRGWPLAEASMFGSIFRVEGLAERFRSVPKGPWADPPNTAAIVPILSGGHRPTGFAIYGISARLRLDESYRGFLEILTSQVGNAITNARAHEEERKRAEALAELDRAKTAFFSNVSHEFRTPLTLLLGPLQEMLSERTAERPAREAESLRSMRRSALRLEKLVNTLLDFSRIEAGRMRASFEPTDLAVLTADIASTFRSTMERAGLRLRVDCPKLPRLVYVDREMWEKIVLNFLSNAFKFTFAGEVEVTLRAAGPGVELGVRDTGIGIAAAELPRIFERFHRVEGARGRTFEGSGIGLALVSELVKLHGGSIRVASEVGKGSEFTVSIPFGSAARKDPEAMAAQAAGSGGGAEARFSQGYTEEALRWVPGEPLAEPGRAAADAGGALEEKASVLVADDNADMRDYLSRLLSPQFSVLTAANGDEALEAIRRERPELVIADVMMPGMDGFALLREIRAGEDTKMLPFILLSARAGEESRLEGLQAGADDYLVKPFSARELISHAWSHVRLERMRRASQRREELIRRHSEEEFRVLANTMPNLAWMAHPNGWMFWYNQRWYEYTGTSPEAMEGWGWESVVEPEALEETKKGWQNALTSGEALDTTIPIRGADGRYRTFLSRAVPVRNEHGSIVRWFGTNTDISEQKEAEDALRRANADLEQFAYSASHDLQEPIRNVAIYGELLSRRYEKSLDERGREYVKFMTDGARRMEMLIKDLLLYRRTTTISSEPLERVDANMALEQALTDLAGAIRDSNAHISSSGLPTLRLRQVHLQQLFQNLIGNAIKYRGGKAPEIGIAAGKSGNQWRFSVKDNGIGIDPKYREVIFGIFKRLHSGAAYSGTGIGLAICQRLVERYGGRIWVESKPGEGSIFYFTLPAAEDRG